MKKINIQLPDNDYEVFVGKNIFLNLQKYISKNRLFSNYVILVDANVYDLYSKQIEKIIRTNNGNTSIIKIRAKESEKSFEQLKKIYTTMLKNKFGRDSLIIAIGGGIIGDVAGFAAATYMRGVQFVQVPTTLLAAVDSSIGGKTGINFFNTKNIIGAFYQPKFVLIDTKFFSTLPPNEFICGLGEIIKYSFLANDNFFRDVKNNLNNVLDNDFAALNRMITKSIKFKGDVVNHKLKHGEAVIVGIGCALHLSNKIGLLNNADLEKYCQLIKEFKKRIKIKKVNKELVYKTMKHDKKNREGKIKFVLIKKIGNILIDVEASKKDVYYAIDKGTGIFL
jgi:3-dehydroquinate synthetase